jgi:heptosyltransferase-3
MFLTTPLVEALHETCPNASIDLLVNKNTEAIAKTLPYIRTIHTYDYQWKRQGRFQRLANELKLVRSIYRNYDLAINLTSSDRSVLYTYFAGHKTISAVEPERSKAWWKEQLITHTFQYSPNRHIVEHTMMPIKLLDLQPKHTVIHAHYPSEAKRELEKLPFEVNTPFLIFHPSAQYDYKIYPRHLRHTLLELLSTLNIPIAVTGGQSAIDRRISTELPTLPNIHNLIGKTSLAGYIALCDHATAYIGMDTLNMHIAAALNKQIFAIFGPTLPQIWSPWCNSLQQATIQSIPIQRYGNIILFQADMPCVACGKTGCDDKHGRSDCLYAIAPETIFHEVKAWLNRSVSQS